jgi:2-polyprenyl-3-methyl-5-hydroxy-6-metoxy-1,4-benzoquinol methylase
MLLFFIVVVILLLFFYYYAKVEYPNCPICRSSKFDEIWKKDKLAMVKCSCCGQFMARPRYAGFRRFLLVQYWSWKDTKNLDRLANTFSEGNYINNIQPKLLILLNNSTASEKYSLLDIGCGTGALLKAAKQVNFDVYGLEPGWFSSRYARKHAHLPILTKMLDKYFTDRKFDFIVCLHVFEHFTDPLAALNKMSTLIKPDGHILIATPNLGSKQAMELGGAWGAVGPADHLFLFNRTMVEYIISKTDFDVKFCGDDGEEEEELVFMLTTKIKRL